MSNVTKAKESKPATIKLIEGEAAINKFLDSIKTRGATLQRDIHIAACSVLAHVGKHHDIRVVTRLLESMPDMTRKNAVKAWFEAHGPVAWGEKGEIMYQPATELKLAAAMGKPFWAFKPESDYVPMVVHKSFDKWVKSLETDAKKTGRNHSALIAKLLAIRPEEDESADRAATNATVAEQVAAAA